MSVAISGILLDPYGNPAPFAEVKFITWQGALDVLTTSSAVYKTSSDGAYSFAVEFGTFTVQVRYNQSNGKFETIKKKVIVNAETTATTLGELLLFNEPLTPPEIEYVKQLVAEAEGYRNETLTYRNETEGFRDEALTAAAEAEQSAIDAANSAAAIVGVPLNGGVWAAGQTFTAYNQYMIFDGIPYAPLTSTTLPYGPVGATPDFNFVGPYPLNDHERLSNLNAIGGHDEIYHRSFDSVADCVAYSGHEIGLRYAVSDYYGGLNPNNSGVLFFKVVAAGTGADDGGKYIDIPGGLYQLEQNLKTPYNSKCWGVAGSNTAAQNSIALQAAIDYGNGLYLSGQVGGGGTDVHTPAGLYDFEGIIDKPGVSRSGDGRVLTVFQLVGDNKTGMKSLAADGQTPTNQVFWTKVSGMSIVPKDPANLTPSGQVMWDMTGYSRFSMSDVFIGWCGGVVGIQMRGATLAGSGGPAQWYNSMTDVFVERLAAWPTGGVGWYLGADNLTEEQVTTLKVRGGRTSGAGGGTGINIPSANTISFYDHTIEGCDDNVILGSPAGDRVTENINFYPLYIEGGKRGITIYPNAQNTGIFGAFISSQSIYDIQDDSGSTMWLTGSRVKMRCQNNPGRWVVNIDNSAANNIPTFQGSSPAIRLLDTVNGKSLRLSTSTQFSEATHAYRVFSDANELIRIGTTRWSATTNNSCDLGWNDQQFRSIHLGTSVIVGGNKVLGSQQAAISDSVGGDESTKINSILSALRAHGLIAT